MAQAIKQLNKISKTFINLSVNSLCIFQSPCTEYILEILNGFINGFSVPDVFLYSTMHNWQLLYQSFLYLVN